MLKKENSRHTTTTTTTYDDDDDVGLHVVCFHASYKIDNSSR